MREGVTSGLNAEAAAVLSAYGQRMASVAVRSESLDALRRGVVAVALAEGRLGDYRDSLFVLSAINDSASLTGTSLEAVIDDVQSLLPSAGRESLRKFDQYRERDKRIEAFGIRRSGTGETFLYV
nr:hypothetical protein [Streptomyces antibioticus]